MIITKNTIEVLKNFSQYNKGIAISAGNKIRSIQTPNKSVFMEYECEEDFAVPFAVYELPIFLSVLTASGDSPDITFNKTEMSIKGHGGQSITKYRYCDPSNIVVPSDKSIRKDPVDVEFELSQSLFNRALNFANILTLPNISFTNDGKKLYVVVNDQKNDSAHTNSIEICDYESKDSFFITFMQSYFTFIPGDYNVQISKTGLAKFTNKTRNLIYWVAIESQGSTFIKG